MYRLYLALRYLRKRRITYLAVLSVALCTAMVLGVHSVFSGFLQTVKESSRRLLSDLTMEIGSMTTFPLYDEFIAEMHKTFGASMVGATPVIHNAGVMTMLVGKGDHPTHPVLAIGVRLDEQLQVNRLGEGLFYDKHYPGTTTLQTVRKPVLRQDASGALQLPPDLQQALGRSTVAATAATQDNAPYPGLFKQVSTERADAEGYMGEAYSGMIIGAGLLRGSGQQVARRVPRGTLVKLTLLPHGRNMSRDAGLGVTEAFRFVDESKTRVHEFDSRSVYCDFDVLQRLLELDGRSDGSGRPRAAQIQIKMAADADLDVARDIVADLWNAFVDRHAEVLPDSELYDMGAMRVQTWQQRNAAFIRAVEKQRVLMLILLGVISLVAVVLVGCIFYMIVQERTQEIGIVKSIGASSWGISGMFLTYAAAVGVVGSILGALGGGLFVHYINDIQDGLARLSPKLQIWSAEVYSFDRIPNIVHASDAVVIMAVGVLAAILGSTVAAAKAAWIWPTKALRYK